MGMVSFVVALDPRYGYALPMNGLSDIIVIGDCI